MNELEQKIIDAWDANHDGPPNDMRELFNFTVFHFMAARTAEEALIGEIRVASERVATEHYQVPMEAVEAPTPLTDKLWSEIDTLIFQATSSRLTEFQVRQVANGFRDFAAQMEARVYALEQQIKRTAHD